MSEGENKGVSTREKRTDQRKRPHDKSARVEARGEMHLSDGKKRRREKGREKQARLSATMDEA